MVHRLDLFFEGKGLRQAVAGIGASSAAERDAQGREPTRAEPDSRLSARKGGYAWSQVRELAWKVDARALWKFGAEVTEPVRPGGDAGPTRSGTAHSARGSAARWFGDRRPPT